MLSQSVKHCVKGYIRQVSLGLLLLTGWITSSWAESEFEQVSFNVSASEAVATDRVAVTLLVRSESLTLAKAAQRTNDTMAWAKARLKGHSALKAQAGSIRSYQYTQRDKTQLWRVEQSLRLEGQQLAVMAKVLAKLQTRLAVEQVQQFLSPAAYEQAEQALMDQALQRLHQRAERLTQGLGFANYRWVEVVLNPSATPSLRHQARQYEVAALQDSVSTPTLDAGEQRVSVSFAARIQLLP